MKNQQIIERSPEVGSGLQGACRGAVVVDLGIAFVESDGKAMPTCQANVLGQLGLVGSVALRVGR